MKKLIAVVALVAAGVGSACADSSKAGYPCHFINNPATCSSKSGGQCVWVGGQCVPAN